MKLVVSKRTGLVFDLDSVPNTPYKRCPVTGEPLDEASLEVVYAEPGNASDPTDAKRAEALTSAKGNLPAPLDLSEAVAAAVAASAKPATATP